MPAVSQKRRRPPECAATGAMRRFQTFASSPRNGEVRPQKLPCVAVGIYSAGASRVFAFALRNQGLRRALRTNPPLHKDAECTPAASTASIGSNGPRKQEAYCYDAAPHAFANERNGAYNVARTNQSLGS